MKSYLQLLSTIENNGTDKLERTGTGTVSHHAYNFRHKLSEGFPLLTTKFVSFKNILTEWKWMMMGMTDVRWLQDHGCTIWDEWATISQCGKFNRVVGDLGPVYGHQWRNFGATLDEHTMLYISSNWFRQLKDDWKNDGSKDVMNFTEHQKDYFGVTDNFKLRDRLIDIASERNVMMKPKIELLYPTNKRTGHNYIYGYHKDGMDQVAWLIKELKFNPNSRRLIVSGWNPKDAGDVALPPCHTLWQLHTTVDSVDGGVESGKRTLNLTLHQRSGDAFLGIPYNIAFYAFMIKFFAVMFDMEAGELVTNTVDGHIYWNHEDAVELQKSREPFKLPELVFDPEYVASMRSFVDSITKESDLLKIGQGFTDLVDQLRVGEDAYVTDYQHHPSIKADVAV